MTCQLEGRSKACYISQLADSSLLTIFHLVPFWTRRTTVPLVCKTWHKLCSDPQLWEHVLLDFPTECLPATGVYPEHEDQPYVDITAVALWIARRLPSLTHLHLDCRHSRTFSNPAFNEDVAMESTPQDFAALLGMLFPKLVSLRIEACDDMVDMGVLGALWCLSALRTLCLHDLAYPIDVRRLSGGLRHLSQLQHLELTCPAPQHAWGLEEFPSMLCTLPALRKLHLVNQRDVHSLPLCISRLAGSLQELVLRDCGICSLPPSLSALSSLTRLAVEGVNDLEAVSLVLEDCLHALPSLRVLSLQGSLLGGCHSVLGTLSALSVLDLSHNTLQPLPQELSRLTALEELRLARNSLSRCPDVLCTLSRTLKRLDLFGNMLASAAASPSDQLPPLPRLAWLDLSQNGLPAVPPHLLDCTALVHLALGGNLLEGVPQEFSRLGCLEKLDLRKNRLPEVPGALRMLSKLQYLLLDGNPLLLDPPGCRVLLALPRLWKLSARGCRPLFQPPDSQPIAIAGKVGAGSDAPAEPAANGRGAPGRLQATSQRPQQNEQQLLWCQLAGQLAALHGHTVLQAEGW